jgi:hypothetical protein
MYYNFDSEFCNYNQSYNLEKIGFDKPCLGYYNSNNQQNVVRVKSDESISKWTKSQYIDMWEPDLDVVVSAPLLQQAFKFFIDNGYHNDVKKEDDSNWQFIIESKATIFYSEYFHTHPECVTACLDKLIDLYMSEFFSKVEAKEEIKNFLKENNLFTFYGQDELIEEFLKISN